eukprot:TRINITY_DN9859_c0_g1_i1.p1 TRINITY_DN9859_c0_g1~~TRINITY_DN9859_c0_g1_i1.p1  ORF type:complete len:303 (-),score=46.45 TRINITY_DN9859_c0_g1_i1:67-975(-)
MKGVRRKVKVKPKSESPEQPNSKLRKIEKQQNTRVDDEKENKIQISIPKKKRKRTASKPLKIQYEKKEPANWRTVYNKIKEMRQENLAPVDTMGCGSWLSSDVSPKVSRYRTLISLMLSSQTRDEVTSATMEKLIRHGLDVDSILNTDDNTLDDLIRACGFHKRKVQYIKKTTQILKDKYDSDVPRTYEDVVSLPGVGPKMGHLLMTFAWNNPVGIGVDVHVHRISNRLGWVNTKTPEKTRVALESWLPREFWGRDGINKLLVGFGQTICKPIGPKCGICKVNDLCPSAFKANREKRRKTID